MMAWGKYQTWVAAVESVDRQALRGPVACIGSLVSVFSISTYCSIYFLSRLQTGMALELAPVLYLSVITKVGLVAMIDCGFVPEYRPSSMEALNRHLFVISRRRYSADKA